jgi:hypothetical protein
MSYSSADLQSTARDAPSAWMRRLWERMTALYGHAWVSVHGVTPHDAGTGALGMSGDTWAKALAGLSDQQVAAGIGACVAEGAEFPPSAPRFRAMCLNIPALAAVRSDLRQRRQPAAFTRAVWHELDVFRYRQDSADQADRMLRDAYVLVRDQVMRGQPLLSTPVADINHDKPEPKPAMPEQVSAYCAAIRDLLAGNAA